MRERWHPIEGRGVYSLDNLAVGDIITVDAIGYRHRPWRVHEIRGWVDDRLRVILRPDGDLYDFAQHNRSVGIRRHASIVRLPEHYAVCHKCGEIPPCSEVWTEWVVAEHAKQDARYDTEGICPSCQEPVTGRQKSHRFEDNLRVPLGPPVTFHARSRCLGGAIAYDQAVATATNRDPFLSCEGHLTRHLDGTQHCTNITCPGLGVRHRSFAMCYALAERCNRPECWALAQTRATARREGH